MLLLVSWFFSLELLGGKEVEWDSQGGREKLWSKRWEDMKDWRRSRDRITSLASYHQAHPANPFDLSGIVRAPLFTTLMQVASRILLIWGIVYPFPNTVAFSPVYSSMLIAWSVTEVIRYSYFAINLSTGSVPALWLWLRYNTFFVLYPLGISSECWLVWKAASGPAKEYTGVREGLVAILLIYIPGELFRCSWKTWGE
jgi:hypothetical protein